MINNYHWGNFYIFLIGTESSGRYSVSKKVANRIIGPLIITKIGYCGAKFCLEHHLGAFDPAFSLKQGTAKITFRKGVISRLLGGDAR